MTAPRKKLIEVALPLEAINREAAREKSIRHGHPSTLHLWWARRPLAAARAVIFAQMVDDPSSVPEEFPTVEAQEAERQRLFRLIEELVLWENTTNEDVLNRARTEIKRSWARWCKESGEDPEKLPPFHDPFAGGGALPLEAQRLGLEAHASDLNPVAVMINKAMIEIPPRFAGRPPVNPEARAKYLGTRASRPHREWNSRGYLPHFDHPCLVQSITFRLADSVPTDVVDGWRAELKLVGGEAADDPRCADLRERIEKYSDEGKGACWLRKPEIAEIVENALLHFDGERYRLLAWCMMPNHVHVLIETMNGFPLGTVVHSWKSFTAKECNKTLQRTGEFWMPDYFDRFIRDARHLRAVVDYIANNPVKAGLCGKPEEWRWSHLGTRASRPHAAGNAGETPAFPGFWRGAAGLAEDVRYYGQWMRDEAEKRIGCLYPKAKVTAEMAKDRPDLRPYVGRELTVIAWLWARTVESSNPAYRGCHVPLVSSFWLSTKAGKEAWVEVEKPRSAGVPPASSGYRFVVRTGKPADKAAVDAGTKLGRGANFRCVLSQSPLSPDYIKAESMAGRMGARLMAVVCEGDRGRVYLPPIPEHEEIARQAKPDWKPEGELNRDTRDLVSGRGYGFFTWADLFTPRQLVALTTFSDLVAEARAKILQDCQSLEKSAEKVPTFGNPAEYANAVSVYLAFAVSKLANLGSTVTSWMSDRGAFRETFARQAIPMVWDYAEANAFSSSGGSLDTVFGKIASVLDFLPCDRGVALQANATDVNGAISRIFSSDPPYYDNIGYADLSDFFYVWMRNSLKSAYPELFGTLLVPKAEELVATPYRHGSKEKAETFFLGGMTKAVHAMAEQAHAGFPVTIYYAFKQAEGDVDGTSSTGWETFLDAIIRAGFAITGTWPMRTEGAGRLIGLGTNALASSIVLVCRPRASDAALATRKDFLATLRRELPPALRHLQEGNIAPVDLAQASIGPGMSVFSRYSRILETDGKPMSVRTALQLINQTLDETLAEQEGDFDPETAWAVSWFEQFGFNDGPFGDAETLSKAKNTALNALVEAGIVKAGAGKTRLVKPGSAGVPPASLEKHPTVWMFTHLLIHALETGGETAAADMLKNAGETPAFPGGDAARELAYRLYSVCERRKRAAEALAYNALVQSWPEIIRLARESASRPKAPVQGELL